MGRDERDTQAKSSHHPQQANRHLRLHTALFPPLPSPISPFHHNSNVFTFLPRLLTYIVTSSFPTFDSVFFRFSADRTLAVFLIVLPDLGRADCMTRTMTAGEASRWRCCVVYGGGREGKGG